MRRETGLIFWLLFVGLFLIIFFLGLYFLSNFFIIEREEIFATLNFGEIPAFDLGNSSFSFGTLSEGTSASRLLKVENGYSFPLLVQISSEGNISRFIFFDKTTKVPAYGEKIISLNAFPAKEDDYGNYSGKIVVVLKKAI